MQLTIERDNFHFVLRAELIQESNSRLLNLAQLFLRAVAGVEQQYHVKRGVNGRKECNLLRRAVLQQFEFLFAHIRDVGAGARAGNHGNSNQIGVYLQRLNVLCRLRLDFGWHRGLLIARARRLARGLSGNDGKR